MEWSRLLNVCLYLSLSGGNGSLSSRAGSYLAKHLLMIPLNWDTIGQEELWTLSCRILGSPMILFSIKIPLSMGKVEQGLPIGASPSGHGALKDCLVASDLLTVTHDVSPSLYQISL